MHEGRWFSNLDNPNNKNMVQCHLCPRECKLRPGQKGFCYVRQNLEGKIYSTTYGVSTGFGLDPIEKKPLNHFYPGTKVLSFGTAGCNLGCRFCQNWHISKAQHLSQRNVEAKPVEIAQAALEHNCKSVAYTYNEPNIWAEYAIDTAQICRQYGIKNVAVTAGYIQPSARCDFYKYMDAANVDLKAFSSNFYRKMCFADLKKVLDTLVYIKHKTSVWLEITTLIIPGLNDNPQEIESMCNWIVKELGDEVPLHFTAFHPDFMVKDIQKTSLESLLQIRNIAKDKGIKYVYTGNVSHTETQSTYCKKCGSLLIERDWHSTNILNLKDSKCTKCNTLLAGLFD